LQAAELKQYIYEYKKIKFVLEQLGCRNIKYNVGSNGDYWSCTNAEKTADNTGAVNIYNNRYLNCINYTRKLVTGDDKKSDLITLANYYRKESFISTVKYIHNILGLEYSYTPQQNKQEKVINTSLLDMYTRANEIKNKCITYKKDITYIDEETMSITPHIHVNYFKEGVIKRTIEKFGLGYNYRDKRTIIPMRHWDTGRLLGYNMRSSQEGLEELGYKHKKCIFSKGYVKKNNIYGLWENKEEILKRGFVIVFESEKAVHKMDSRMMVAREIDDESGEIIYKHIHIETCVALSGHEMSYEQARILRSLGVEIIICMDNDVSLQEVRHMCEKFWLGSRVSYMCDEANLLPPKSNISDVKIGFDKMFEIMLNTRKVYDEKERAVYLRELNMKA